MNLNYSPPPTLRKFHLSTNYGRFVIGPVGSGKTFALFMELLRVAAQQAPATDGKRYTRMAIVRNTLQQIKTTVVSDIMDILRPIANLHVSTNTVQIRVGDIVSDWLLIPLEDERDQRRLLSTQFTVIALEEFREINYNLLDALVGRPGRYPSKAMVPNAKPRTTFASGIAETDGGATQWGIIGTSNPFPIGSDWHNNLIVEPKPDFMLLRQPSALGPDAENLQNLKKNYYQLMIANNSPEWVKVHVEGEFGDDESGKAVFGRLFSREHHCDDKIVPNPMRPLTITMDFGRHAAALICQVDEGGRLLVLEEIIGDDLGLHNFLSEHLIPVLQGARYAGFGVHVIGDPKGRDRSQLSDETAFDVVKAYGLPVYAAATNEVDKRIRAVQGLLQQNRRGRAAIAIDPARCPKLVRAMIHEYRYRMQQNGILSPKPDKTHPWSDVADALQYAALAINADLPSRIIARQQARLQRVPELPVAAWT